ncbi:MAG: hypothetical protein HY921_05105 [Elusimicrobia bacterium]|nr:hypothetical protein [Elusimicrobiota bacterium]
MMKSALLAAAILAAPTAWASVRGVDPLLADTFWGLARSRALQAALGPKVVEMMQGGSPLGLSCAQDFLAELEAQGVTADNLVQKLETQPRLFKAAEASFAGSINQRAGLYVRVPREPALLEEHGIWESTEQIWALMAHPEFLNRANRRALPQAYDALLRIYAGHAAQGRGMTEEEVLAGMSRTWEVPVRSSPGSAAARGVATRLWQGLRRPAERFMGSRRQSAWVSRSLGRLGKNAGMESEQDRYSRFAGAYIEELFASGQAWDFIIPQYVSNLYLGQLSRGSYDAVRAGTLRVHRVSGWQEGLRLLERGQADARHLEILPPMAFKDGELVSRAGFDRGDPVLALHQLFLPDWEKCCTRPLPDMDREAENLADAHVWEARRLAAAVRILGALRHDPSQLSPRAAGTLERGLTAHLRALRDGREDLMGFQNENGFLQPHAVAAALFDVQENLPLFGLGEIWAAGRGLFSSFKRARADRRNANLVWTLGRLAELAQLSLRADRAGLGLAEAYPFYMFSRGLARWGWGPRPEQFAAPAIRIHDAEVMDQGLIAARANAAALSRDIRELEAAWKAVVDRILRDLPVEQGDAARFASGESFKSWIKSLGWPIPENLK